MTSFESGLYVVDDSPERKKERGHGTPSASSSLTQVFGPSGCYVEPRKKGEGRSK